MVDLDAKAVWLGRHVLPHEPALRSWLQARRVAGLDVDDIIQEAYTRLMRMDDLTAIRDPKSYAFQAAKSVIHTHLRRAKVVPMSSVADLESLGLADDASSPEDYAAGRDELRRLAAAIADLPEGPGRVFKMRRVDDKSQKQIAAELGISEGAVERLMGEALFRLRKMFGRQGNARSGASNTRTARQRRADGSGERPED